MWTPSIETQLIYGVPAWEHSQITPMQPAQSITCLEACSPTQETSDTDDPDHNPWACFMSEGDVAGKGHGHAQGSKSVTCEPRCEVRHISEETPGGSEGSNRTPSRERSPRRERRSSEVDGAMIPPGNIGLISRTEPRPARTAENAPEPIDTFPGCMPRDPVSFEADPDGVFVLSLIHI